MSRMQGRLAVWPILMGPKFGLLLTFVLDAFFTLMLQFCRGAIPGGVPLRVQSVFTVCSQLCVVLGEPLAPRTRVWYTARRRLFTTPV